MPTRNGQKLKALAVLEALRRESDEGNPLSAEQLCEMLGSIGISAERKSIYGIIDDLNGFGYDIIHTRTPKAGYYLAQREFELPEIYLLTDAVQAADFITVKKTRELVKKLEGLLSTAQAKKREKGIYIDTGRKCDNEEIYYNIDTLSAAISDCKKVRLIYRVREIENRKISFREKEYELSPYALIWQNGHYYLVCNHAKYDNLMHIRLDRIKKVKITDTACRPYSEVSDYKDKFDIADYIGRTFNMYAGELIEIKLKCGEDVLEQVIDRFGDDIFITDHQKGYFTFSAKVFLSKGLTDWIIQFTPKIAVLSPEKLKTDLAKRIEELKDIY